jgi:hypothetical protein
MLMPCLLTALVMFLLSALILMVLVAAVLHSGWVWSKAGQS